jgi:hypothetical protein
VLFVQLFLLALSLVRSFNLFGEFLRYCSVVFPVVRLGHGQAEKAAKKVEKDRMSERMGGLSSADVKHLYT